MIGNIGLLEFLLILLFFLLLFGSRRLPEVGRSIGMTLRELKRSASGALEDGRNEKARAGKPDSNKEETENGPSLDASSPKKGTG